MPEQVRHDVFRIPMTPSPRRTFAIISHPDAGKTTLTEKLLVAGGAIHLAGEVKARGARSEEHTAELQSLMRISYAVFCLKTNRTHKTNALACDKNPSTQHDT